MKDLPVCEGAERKLRLSFVGDVCRAGGLQSELRQFGADYPFRALKAAFDDADIEIGSLEFYVIEEAGLADPPVNVMTSPASLPSGLASSGIGVVSLTNNHLLDAGESGLNSTCRFLDGHGMLYFGADHDLPDAERQLILGRMGFRVALLAACDAPHFYAGNDQAGVPAMDSRRLAQRVAECRDMVDVVVVSIHADLEFLPYSSPSRLRLSRFLVDHGADLVIQHHPHVCQGVEARRQGLIAYSLGNFVFRVQGNDYFSEHAGTDWGLILKVDLTFRGASAQVFKQEFIPAIFDGGNQTH